MSITELLQWPPTWFLFIWYFPSSTDLAQMWFCPPLLKTLACSTSIHGIRALHNMVLAFLISPQLLPSQPTQQPHWAILLPFLMSQSLSYLWALLVHCCLLSTGNHVWVSMTLLPLLGFTGETANQSEHHLSAGLDSDSESSTRGSCGLSQQTEMDINTNTVFHVALVQLWPLCQVICQDPGPMASLPWHFPHLPASVDHFALATAHRPSPWGFCLLVFGFAW